MLDRHYSRFPLLFCIGLCGLVFSGLGAAQTRAISDPELPALLARLSANVSSNGILVQQYTSDEFWHNRNLDRSRKLTVDESAKYEHVFVGLPYRKKVEENGKPLNAKEAAAEEQRYEQAVKKRRAMTTRQKRLSLHKTWHSTLPMCCLTTLFENHVAGYEQLDGREMLIVDSIPRPDAKPSNKNEESTLNWRQRSWIDLSDEMFARVEAESLIDANHMGKGTTIRIDFDRVIETSSNQARPERAVWLLHSVSTRGHFKMLWIDSMVETDQTWSNYRKFHVDMRLLEESVAPLDEPSATLQSQP